MSMGNFESGKGTPMAEINMTPLVDVMLVLLIIFIVTAPLMAQSLKVDLPQAKGSPLDAKPEVIKVMVDKAGFIYYNEEQLHDDDTLKQRLQAAAQKSPPPEMHLSADKDARYQRIADVMSAARESGIEKLGFVTLPPKK